MKNLVVMTRDDLEDLLRQIVENVNSVIKVGHDKKLKMTIDEALVYMKDHGYPISKSTMYKHTMAGTIPFKRFGDRKILFDANELDQWIEERLS